MNTVARLLLAASLMLVSPSVADEIDLEPEIGARGWFFRINGSALDTRLKPIGFDKREGQPEFWGSLRYGRHRFGVDFLRIRREEMNSVSGTVLGVPVANSDVFIDVQADYARLHYGYDFPILDWALVEPFLELGLLNENTVVIDQTTNQSNQSDTTVVFPLPGLELTVWPGESFHPRAKISGMQLGGDHLLDFEAGFEWRIGVMFLQVGYRVIDLAVEERTGDVEVSPEGVTLGGGFLF